MQGAVHRPRSVKGRKQRHSCLSVWVSNGELGSLSAGNLLVKWHRGSGSRARLIHNAATPTAPRLSGRTALLNMNNTTLGGGWLKIYILCLCHYKLLTVQGAGKKDSVPLIIYFLIQTKMEFYAPLITSATTGKTLCTSHYLKLELSFHFQKFFFKFPL